MVQLNLGNITSNETTYQLMVNTQWAHSLAASVDYQKEKKSLRVNRLLVAYSYQYACMRRLW